MGRHAPVAANTAWSDDKKLIELASAARHVQDRVVKAFSSATDALNKAMLGVEPELAKPIEGGTAITQMASKIRAYARTLSATERTSLLTTAIKEGDSRTVIALLDGLAYLRASTPRFNPTSHSSGMRKAVRPSSRASA